MTTPENKAISPESVPSLAETSYASSHGGGDEDDTIVRFLFGPEKPSGSIVPKEIVENIEKISDDMAEQREGGLGCAVSITSSETTVVAGRNLSLKDPNATPQKENQGCIPSMFDDPSEDNDNGDDEETPEREQAKPPKLVYEEPPQAAASCNNPLSLTPKQLADIFMAFEGAQRIWPPNKPAESTAEPVVRSESTDTVSSPVRADNWMPRAESLERECNALKKIIQDDSSKLLNLKSAMEAQRDLNSLKDAELEERRIELRIYEERLLAVKREREEFRERESELIETIHILKSEVDILTRYKATMEALLESQDSETSTPVASENLEWEEMKEKLSSFEAKISEQEKVIADLRSTVDSKEKESCELKKQLDELKKEEKENEDNAPPELAEIDAESPNGKLEQLLLNISQRLEMVETEKEKTEKKFSMELQQKNDEINQIRQMLSKDDAHSQVEGTKDRIKISEDPDEIEVTMPAQKQLDRKVQKSEDADCCCVSTDCDVWSAISGDHE